MLIGAAVTAVYSDFRKSEIEHNAKNHEADQRYDAARDALSTSRPATLADATRVIGEDPLSCGRDDEAGGVCRWHFNGRWIRIFATDTKRGAAVVRVEFGDHY